VALGAQMALRGVLILAVEAAALLMALAQMAVLVL
jgi:hypothetical protein